MQATAVFVVGDKLVLSEMHLHKYKQNKYTKVYL